MSSRRVPKGPGRRPMTDKRRQFLELLAEGWSVRSACKKLGISRSSGNRWKNGWLERQKGGTVKFVPPLDPLDVRTISPRFLSESERIQFADLASRGLGPTAIGRPLGRAPSRDLLLTREPEDPYAYLLSGDKRAFMPQRHRQLLDEIEELGVEWEVQILTSISEFEVPGQFLDEAGSLDAAQERQLHDTVQDALLAGGTPRHFTHVFAERSDFDAADISEVLVLEVTVERVQVERKSRVLWINYTAEATCLVRLESIESLDEEAGNYATIRDVAVWNPDLTGNAYSSGSSIDNVASLRLVWGRWRLLERDVGIGHFAWKSDCEGGAVWRGIVAFRAISIKNRHPIDRIKQWSRSAQLSLPALPSCAVAIEVVVHPQACTSTSPRISSLVHITAAEY